MTERPPVRSDDTVAALSDEASAPTRAELEARMATAREAITQTVEQIKGTVEERVDAVAETVSGVLTMSEQFQREPVAWSLGALSAGFAMGYSLGRAHHAKAANGRPSQLARLADDLAAELATFGGSLVSPGLGEELKATFGVDLTAALERIAAMQTRPKPSPKRLPARSATRTPARGVRRKPPTKRKKKKGT
jgi:hypothetical protein